MYSRNRTRQESSYRDQIPSSYSGTLFTRNRSSSDEIPVRDERKPIPEVPSDAMEVPADDPETSLIPPEPDTPAQTPARKPLGFLPDIGQEEMLLLVLLLLLSGEKDHPMDLIVILLLLLSTQ